MKRILLLALAALMSVGAYAQKADITGTITDSNNEPVVGAVVQIVEDPTVGVEADLDGHYSISAKEGQTLRFSMLGYFDVDVKVGSNKVVNVVMKVSDNVLNEAVATGYSSVSRKNLTTAISKVEAEKVDKIGTANMSQMLLGRAAGLQATMASAQPGGGVNISIRGGGTPIYIVDGIVMPASSMDGGSGGTMTVMPSSINRSGLAGINPEDIESIEVLKDASAAIYGVNASNGVILITTKKGMAGTAKVTYDGAYSITKAYPYVDMVSGPDYMRWANAFKLEKYLFDNKQAPYGDTPYDGKNTDLYTQERIANAGDYDWAGQILRDGQIHKHSLVVSGGAGKTNYYISGQFFQQDGNVENNDMTRYIIRSNVSTKITDFITLGTNLNYAVNKNHNGTVGGSSAGRGPQASGSLRAALSYPRYIPFKDDAGNYSYFQTIPNAVSMLDMTDENKATSMNANFTLDVDIIKNMLKFKGVYGYYGEKMKRMVYIPSTVYYDMMFKSRGSIDENERSNDTFEATLSFTHKFFDEKLDVNALAGVGRYLNHGNGFGIAYDQTNDLIANDDLSAAAGKKVPSSYRNASEKRSFFSTLSLDYDDKYVLAGTIRRDGTDKFFPGKKYSWFPAVSAAWKIYNENFMKDIKWINMLKLRASYGVTGYDTITSDLYGAYGTLTHLVKFNQNTTTYVPITLTSRDYPEITWQKTIMKNIGVDFVFLDNRISGNLDFFMNDITDQLTYGNTAALSMFSSQPINFGHVRRQGWDATINTQNIVKKDFTWSSYLTLSRYRAYWIEREPNYSYSPYQIRHHEATNISYFYKTDGFILPDKSNMPATQPEGWQYPGMPIIVDKNGDGEITMDDIYHKEGFPKIYFGFGNTFTYKNWDLDIFMYSQLGVVKGDPIRNWISFPYAGDLNVATEIKKVYNSSTNYKNAKYPGVANSLAGATLPEGCGTDIGRDNADFLRVRNITLGYNFNTKKFGRLSQYISALRIYADAQNPFTFTHFKTFDPEINSWGSGKAAGGEYPMIRTFTLGVKATF